MTSPKYRNVLLNVLAVDGKDVHEIDENGKPLMALRTVGKKAIVIDPQHNQICYQVVPGGCSVPYHSYYVAKLKEGSLLATDQETASLAGVKLSKGNK